VIVVRYADDSIVGFEHWHEAKQFLPDLKVRQERADNSPLWRPLLGHDQPTIFEYTCLKPLGDQPDDPSIADPMFDERSTGCLTATFNPFSTRLAKTPLIEFGRRAIARRRSLGLGKPETFNFLGFTHYCATRTSGSKAAVTG
jgi:hypothetical protein